MIRQSASLGSGLADCADGGTGFGSPNAGPYVGSAWVLREGPLAGPLFGFHCTCIAWTPHAGNPPHMTRITETVPHLRPHSQGQQALAKPSPGCAAPTPGARGSFYRRSGEPRAWQRAPGRGCRPPQRIAPRGRATCARPDSPPQRRRRATRQ